VSDRNASKPSLVRILILTLFAFAALQPSIDAATGPSSAQISDTEVNARVVALLKQMTLEEKIGQLSQQFVFDKSDEVKVAEPVAKGQLGSLLFVTDPAVINHFQHLVVEETRLHIPLIFGFDVIHGFRTIFPVPIGMAASWDPSVEEKGQTIAAQEARAVGIDWAFAPMLDIARDPRWGRIVEGAGEDPYLGSAMAVAQVRGFQGPYIGSPDHILACMKHFAGYGAAEGGRDYDASYIPEDQMWNVYLPPFHAAVKAGVGSAMSAYMDLNDVPATGNRWLLEDVLRKDWDFKGFVVSDADAVKNLKTHGYVKDLADAAVRGLTAGVDMEMSQGPTAYSRELAAAVASGKVTVEQIDESVSRILAAKIRLGLFEHPYVDEARAKQILATPEHRIASREAAERSAVLLRNEGHLLPLKSGAYHSIAVIGPTADSKIDTIGSWAFQEDLNETVTLFNGIRGKAGTGTHVSYAPGVQIWRKIPSMFDEIFHVPAVVPWSPDQAAQEMQKAVDLAKNSDLTILVLGEAQNMSGERASRESLELPGKEPQLLDAIAATGKPIVLVLMNGRPLNITWASTHVPAILEAWYPGTQGGNAIANVLFGDVVPGGKLPIAWPRNVGQIPINYAHNTTFQPEEQGRRYWDEESVALYPFGYGLSYSTFRFSNIKVSQPSVRVGQSLDVTAEVENTGDTTADEVAQLYIHQQYGSTSRPVRELKGFTRITIPAHQKETVHFTITPDDLRYWSTATRDWVQDFSDFDVWVGGDSTTELHSAFTVTP
jgi:beta-glucosidase